MDGADIIGYSVSVPDAYLVGGDGSRAIRVVCDATGAPALLAAPGARGSFARVPLPSAGPWTAPRVCAWSPAGGVLGGIAGDTSCVLAVGSGPRALLCARAAALRACVQAGLPGPAGGAWEPPDAPVHATWAVLPLDVVAGSGGEGCAFTALAWAPRLYRHAAGARSYLALGSACGELQLLRLSFFSRELWPSELPALPCVGVLGGGALEGLVVARARPAGGGRGLASVAWVGRKSVALGWGNGAVCLMAVEGRAGGGDSNWDGGATLLPAVRLLPPNGAPAVALRYEAGCLAAARGQALSLAWPAGEGGGGGGGGGGMVAQPDGARPRWRVTAEAPAQGRALTIENAHDGSITGVHLASPAGGGGAVAYTAALDGSVRSWATRAAPGWLPGGARPPLMRLVDAGAGGVGGALAASREAGAPPPPPSLRAAPLYGLSGDATALALAALTCVPVTLRVHAPPARAGARKTAAAAAEAALHATERRLMPLAISLLPFPSASRLSGAAADASAGGAGFGAVSEALTLALGALAAGAARVGRGVAAEGPGALLCPPGPDDAGDRDVAALCAALERYGDAAAAAARAWTAGFGGGAWVRKPGWGAPGCVGDLTAEAAAWLQRRDCGGDGAPAAPTAAAAAAEDGAMFRPVFAAERRSAGAPTSGVQWMPRPICEGVGGERAEWYASFSPEPVFAAARGGGAPAAAAATATLLAALRAAAGGVPLHASLQALLPLFLLGCVGAAQAAPSGAAAPHLRIALRACHHVLHTALEALLARHAPAPGCGGGGGGEGEPGTAAAAATPAAAAGRGGGEAPPSAALVGGDALPSVTFLGARRRLSRAPALPPRWAWYAAAVAPRLHLWLRCEELRLVSRAQLVRCEANNEAWKASLALAAAALHPAGGGCGEEGCGAVAAAPLLEPALLADLRAWQPLASVAAPTPGAAGWTEPLPAQPLSNAATWLAPEVALALPPSFILAQALEACGGPLEPRW